MSTEQPLYAVSAAASGDLSTKQYFLVKRHTVAGQCALVDGTGDIPLGILQNKPAAAGRAAEVVVLGRSKAQVEATTDIAIGDKLGPNTDGRLIVKTADKAVYCAIAEEAATAATGDIITVMMQSPAYISAS
jgi:hypothetical protein